MMPYGQNNIVSPYTKSMNNDNASIPLTCVRFFFKLIIMSKKKKEE